jgi:hypothetical protein
VQFPQFSIRLHRRLDLFRPTLRPERSRPALAERPLLREPPTHADTTDLSCSAVGSDPVVTRVLSQLDPVALGAAVGFVSGVGLLLASAVLLLRGGAVVGPNLSLLGQYLPGFRVTWAGAVLGLVEAAIGGFALGYATAWLRHHALGAWARHLQRRAVAAQRRRLVDEV